MYLLRQFFFFLVLPPVFSQTIRDFPAGYRTEWLATANSTATAVSNNGFVAGYYSLQDGRVRGFLRNPAGDTIDIEYPGALKTRIESVNSSGAVVGSYEANGMDRGFLRLANGTYTSFDVPGAKSTVLTGINDAGQVVGYFVDSADESQMVTFVNPASPQILSVSANNRAWDIGPDGWIAGSYPGLNTWTGFVRGPGGAVASFPSPCPASQISSLMPLAVNGAFEVAGTCSFRAGLFFYRSFLRLSNGRTLVIGDSASSGDFLLSLGGINDAGDLAGSGRDSTGGMRALLLHPCAASNVEPTNPTAAASGGVVTFTATAAADCRLNASAPGAAWAVLARTSNSSFQVTLEPNPSPVARTTSLFVAGANITIQQDAGICTYTLTGNPATFPASGGSGTVTVTAAAGCPWTAVTASSWISLASASGTGNGSLTFSVAPNTTSSTRTGSVGIGGQQFILNQAADPVCSLGVTITGGPVPASGGAVTLTIATGAGCPWGLSSPSTFIGIPPHIGVGPATLQIGFAPNPAGDSRTATLIVSGTSYQVIQSGSGGSPSGLRFVPVTPCRVADTRPEGGKTGGFGPPRMTAGSTRGFEIPQSGCGIPSTARAYALNITVVPAGYLGYLTAFPTGQSQGGASTLNSWNGRVVANAAIVAAGSNASVSVFVTDPTDVIIDVNGYFTNDAGLAFYPVQPCRVADTRVTGGKTGQFGPPSISGQTSRSFAIPLAGCGIPANAQAYSTNVTAVPSSYLGFLTLWPSGQTQPFVSTLNSWDAQVVPNAAIVPAGTNGAISVYASNPTDVVIDINGYFAAAGQPGALLFYPQPPCRLVDTREDLALAAMLTRTFPVSGRCGVPGSARAYVFNTTAVPNGYLGFVTLWPGGDAQPFVSTLNSWNGQVVANAAIVPSGNGSIGTYVSNAANLILDLNGYFAP